MRGGSGTRTNRRSSCYAYGTGVSNSMNVEGDEQAAATAELQDGFLVTALALSPP